MNGESPGSARPRPDLTWLRHRTLRRPPVAAPVPTPGPPSLATAPSPGPSSSLDLSGPPDRSELLELSPAALLPAEKAPVRGTGAVPAPVPRRPVPRVASAARLILTQRDPTVTLNRVQSGVGTLAVEAICSPAVGDVRLGALYQLGAGGTSGIVQLATGIAAAPAQSRRPVIAASGGQYDRLTIDLRQSRALSRMVVYAFSESGRELDWGGTLRLTTFGGSRVELPLDLGRHQGPIALLSLYGIDGEFVLRAEAEPVDGATRDVAQAFGYTEISWADDRTPIG